VNGVAEEIDKGAVLASGRPGGGSIARAGGGGSLGIEHGKESRLNHGVESVIFVEKIGGKSG
jgi:hypothetical protein